MQVASIVSVPFLDLIQGKPYQMCLAHLAQEDDAYAAVYREEAAAGNFVLLDNGAAEKAQPTLAELFEIIGKIQPTEFILPDELFDGSATLDRSYKALHALAGTDLKVKTMAVPQGETLEEWLQCAREMLTWPINTIGISKFMNYKMGPYIRHTMMLKLERMCRQMNSSVQVHLLGCAYDPREVEAIGTAFPRVRGTDSSIPYVYATQGVTIHTALRDGIPRSQEEVDFYEAKTNPALIAANISMWEAICRGEL